MKTHKIYVWSSETGNKVTSWPVYRCLVAEIELNNDTYILSMAQWKKVSTDFKQEVEDYVSDIPSIKVHTLPTTYQYGTLRETKIGRKSTTKSYTTQTMTFSF